MDSQYRRSLAFTAPAAGISCGTVISFTEDVANVVTITGVSGVTMVHQTEPDYLI